MDTLTPTPQPSGTRQTREPIAHPRTRARAFTLIEMLLVLAIAAFIMGLSITAFRDFGRGAGVRGAMLHTKSGFNHARQYAITHRVLTTFHLGNDNTENRGFYYITIPTNQLLGTTNYLGNGIVFSTGPGFFTNPVTFKFDGSATLGADRKTIGIQEWGMGTNGMSGSLQLNPLTGRIRSTVTRE